MAGGAVVWVGAGGLGPRDGRVRLYLAEHAPLLLRPAGMVAAGSPALTAPGAGEHDSPVHLRIRAELRARGALFFAQILQGSAQGGTGGFVPDVLAALWDLVWAGEVTNDTLQPLRAWPGPGRAATAGGRRAFRNAGSGVGPGMPGIERAGGGRRNSNGRWSLVLSLVRRGPGAGRSPAARARQLMDVMVLTRRRFSPRASRAASPRCTPRSRPWRRRAACAAATS